MGQNTQLASIAAVSLYYVAWPIVCWIGCAFFSAYMAGEKGRWGAVWFIWGVLFGPVALVAIAGLPPRVQAVEEVSLRERPNRNVEPQLVRPNS